MVIATGISSVVTQLLIIREFLSQFQGNEFVIALILFNWLTLGGIGTLSTQWVNQRLLQVSANRLGWLSLILAGLPAIQICHSSTAGCLFHPRELRRILSNLFVYVFYHCAILSHRRLCTPL